jgi:hypothetical protein
MTVHDAGAGDMSGRRRHSRIRFSDSQGVLRISRDVIVRRGTGNELIALSGQAGVVGDVLTLAIAADDSEVVRARVLCTRPIMVDGAMTHEWRLAITETAAES